MDFGAAFLAQNQDPTLVSATPGAASMLTNIMRPYRGFGAINMTLGRFWNSFHSIQTSYNRRFRNGLQFGLNYTLTLSQSGTNTPLQRLCWNVGITHVDEHVRLATFMPFDLGYFDDETCRLRAD